MNKLMRMKAFFENYVPEAERQDPPKLRAVPTPAPPVAKVPRVRTGGSKPHTATRGLCAKAWRSMRHLRQFTLNDLLDANATGAEKDAPGVLGKYLLVLERHGVLLRLNRRAPGMVARSNGHVIWWLAFDLGWEPPVWRRDSKTLWNPNTSEIVAPAPPPGEPT